jgi:tripartite motif-containing protein 56
MFTHLGKIGCTGPTTIGTNYDGQAHKDLTIVQNGIQFFTVPYTGVYTITAVGAAGGQDKSSSSYIGRGTKVGGDFNLEKGQVLKILVGQVGKYNSPYKSAGGGGGSFVATSSNVPLIIGGGGGGIESVTQMYSNAHGNTGTAGKPNGGVTSSTSWSGGSDGYGATEADSSNSGNVFGNTR